MFSERKSDRDRNTLLGQFDRSRGTSDSYEHITRDIMDIVTPHIDKHFLIVKPDCIKNT